MISLSEHRTGLSNLSVTLDALDDIDRLLTEYEKDVPGPAYCTFTVLQKGVKVQLDRSIARAALRAQRTKLVNYLATMGIDANK